MGDGDCSAACHVAVGKGSAILGQGPKLGRDVHATTTSVGSSEVTFAEKSFETTDSIMPVRPAFVTSGMHSFTW